MANFSEKAKVRAPNNERIDYWFKPQQKHKLTFLLNQIAKLTDKKEKDFFLCALSNILKNCSMWMQKSTKPTRDFHKKPVDPFMAFIRQTQIMLKKNADFFDLLNEKGTNNISCKAFCCDARELPVDSGSASLVVTSPPYVTSYEYADLHQLSALWFEYTQDLQIFRKNFIGSSHHARHDRKPIFLNSDIAEKIRSRLAVKDKKKEHEVATYFSEMNEAFVEMKRVLKPKGRICIVIGNTSFKGVDILNAEVFAEQFLNLGFKMENLIKREIPSKNLPSTRDIRTGRFVSATSKNKFLAYPTEYILILQKL